MSKRPLTLPRAVALLAAVALLVPAFASAALTDEQALAKRFAPVVRLVTQAKDCGSGESFDPIDVNVLFDEATVALRGPWGRDLVMIAPAADDLTAARYEYHLDFPGNALDPGCDYEHWANLITKGSKPTVYAHVATDPARPGKLALQYWFYYVFNQWNNTHEGDWEMIQLNFDASTAAQALKQLPTATGYSQHEGAERAAWDDPKLAHVGDHPVVYPAAGSHANFYGSALYLGASGSEGVGCDDTRSPTHDAGAVVQTIPSDQASARAAFPWIAFAGRWGELQRAFFNGPTGPNLKTSWESPITWSEGWRDRSVAVPGGGALGTGATDFFCGAIAAGSNGLRRSLDQPLIGVGALAALIILIAYAISRTTWRPVAPLRLARRRAWGQILAAAARVYSKKPLLFLGIGLLALPISVVVTLLQALFLHASSVFGIEIEGANGGVLVYGAVAIGTALTLLGLGLVMAATARALVDIDAGRPTSPAKAYREALTYVWSLLGALVIASVVISALVVSVFLIPLAIWLVVRWALIVPVVVLEDRSAANALRRSARLVRLGWFKTGSLAVVGAALALAAGPVLSGLLIILTSTPLAWLNIVSGLIYAAAMPFVALATIYVYFDMRVRDETAVERGVDDLPAEIEYRPDPAGTAGD